MSLSDFYPKQGLPPRSLGSEQARARVLNRHRASIKSIFEPVLRDQFVGTGGSEEVWLNWFRNSLIRYLREDYAFCKSPHTKHNVPLLQFIANDVEKLYSELMEEDT